MQTKPQSKKGLAIGIIFLFIGTSVIPSTSQTIEKSSSASRGNTLYVGGSGPGNYTRIQDAINDSLDGDTILVYDDNSPYRERIVVDKSILLIGENKDTTIIEGSNGTVVRFSVNKVRISGFTIRHSGPGVSTGIKASTSNNIISNNIIIGHLYGIFLFGSNNTINSNFIISNEEGIRLDGSINNTIYWNELAGSTRHSMDLTLSHSNHIYENNFRRGTSMIQHVWWIDDFIFFLRHPLNRNQWDKNYWNRPRSVPKILPGILLWPLAEEYFYIIVHCCQVDKHPAQQPNNITGMS